MFVALLQPDMLWDVSGEHHVRQCLHHAESVDTGLTDRQTFPSKFVDARGDEIAVPE